jgi:peptidyl-tRNA hydrolase, PTH1 family
VSFFRRKPQESIQPEWLIVGLGNPGAEYRGTRHNVGFDVIEEVAKRHKIKLDKSRNRALTGAGRIDGTPVLLVKPLTYMNLSGQAVAPIAKANGVKPERVLVIADDLDLSLAKVRLKMKGSAGGHNGHKSIIGSLGTQEYPRIKIGIGASRKGQTIDHVLSPFLPDEREEVSSALQTAADMVEALLTRGEQHAQELAASHNRRLGCDVAPEKD